MKKKVRFFMGLKVGEVELKSYDYKWKDDFKKEKEELKKILGDLAITIEHVGSTAVERLSAKPIIDISVGVKTLPEIKALNQMFFDHSQYSVKEDSVEGEILVRKGPEDNRTHFIHIMEVESDRYKDTILFRDYLISHPDDLLKYEKLKTELAKKYPNERKMYTSSKNGFITDLMKKAKEEDKS